MGFLSSVGRALARNVPKIFKGQTAAKIFKGAKQGAMNIAKGAKSATQKATQLAKTAIRKIKNIFKKKPSGVGKEKVISKGGKPEPKLSDTLRSQGKFKQPKGKPKAVAYNPNKPIPPKKVVYVDDITPAQREAGRLNRAKYAKQLGKSGANTGPGPGLYPPRGPQYF